MACGIQVVTVIAVDDKAPRCFACNLAPARPAIAITVAIQVPGAGPGGPGLVDVAVTVIVDAVTGLGRAGVDRRVLVVAILVRQIPVTIGIGAVVIIPLPATVTVQFVDLVVTVIVVPVAAVLGSSGVRLRIRIVAIHSRAVSICIEIDGNSIDAVAVLIGTITGLILSTWMNGGIRVIAVNGVAVPIKILVD